MKSDFCLKNLAVLMIVVFTSFTALAQECAQFIPVKPGTKMEIKQYSADNQLHGTIKTTVKTKTPTAKGYNVDVLVQSTDLGGHSTKDKSLTFKCENGNFLWDLNDMVKQLLPSENNQNMEFRTHGTPLKFPAEMVVGQKLEDAVVNILVQRNQRTLFEITANFTERKVTAIEKITTPAGTYSCYKINYKIESKSMNKLSIHMVDYLTKGIGIVRSEQYDQNNKLTGYSVLSSYKE